MLTIRSATADDIPALLPLNAAVQAWHADHYPDRFHADPGLAEVTAFLASKIEDPRSFIDIALWEEQPAGYTYCSLNVREGSPFTLQSRHLHVEHIAVAPEHRRKGIASALLEAAATRAGGLDCSEVNLTSWAENTDALAAFRAAGFEVMRHWFARPLLQAPPLVGRVLGCDKREEPSGDGRSKE